MRRQVFFFGLVFVGLFFLTGAGAELYAQDSKQKEYSTSGDMLIDLSISYTNKTHCDIGTRDGGTNTKPYKNQVKKIKSTFIETSQSCNRKNVRQVASQGKARVRYCYEKALQTNSSIKTSRAVIHWIIGTEGEIMDVELANATANHEHLVGCLGRAMKSLKFKPPKGGPCTVAFHLNLEFTQ